MKKILFGAGMYGRIALKQYGRDNVAFFVDNNNELIGSFIDGIEIISFAKLKEIYRCYQIVICTKFSRSIEEQLGLCGITYELFLNGKNSYFATDELIVNPYEYNGEFVSSSDEKNRILIDEINAEVDELYETMPLFSHVEIETVNRCNGKCSFCPVSVGNDIRPLKKMPWELFVRIIDQLSEIAYDGKLALFSNNEPFIDEGIVEKHRYAREKLPHAKMHLYTNGSLLTIEKLLEVEKYLDGIVIDNYNQELTLNEPVKLIAEYCGAHPELKKKVSIVLRKEDEILSNRGGDAPNVANCTGYPNAKCPLPFKQMIIRPDGKVSLCCNDPYGKDTLADLTKDTLVEAWNSTKFKMVRKCLYEGGRANWPHCKQCDTLNLG